MGKREGKKKGGVTEAVVEGRGGVQDDFEAGGLGDLVEGGRVGDVGHDSEGEGARGRFGGVGVADARGLGLAADRRHDRVSLGEEQLEDVGWGVSIQGFPSS